MAWRRWFGLRRLAAAVASIALLIGVSPTMAQTGSVSPSDKAAIALAAERGKLIYAYDQAAWHATDLMLINLRDAQSRVGGWVVDGPASTPTVVFFDRNEASRHALYTVRFDRGVRESPDVLPTADGEPLSADRLKLVEARSKGLAAFASAKVGLCGKSPNTVVLPPSAPGSPILIYLLTPQATLDSFPLGGHFRVEVGEDGTTRNLRSFANSCITMPPADPNRGRGAMFFVTHLLDPVPTEIHVFTSLASHVPLAVGTTTNRIVWAVDGADIRYLQTLPTP